MRASYSSKLGPLPSLIDDSSGLIPGTSPGDVHFQDDGNVRINVMHTRLGPACPHLLHAPCLRHTAYWGDPGPSDRSKVWMNRAQPRRSSQALPRYVLPGAITVNGQMGITGSPSRTPQALTSSLLVAPMSMYMSLLFDQLLGFLGVHQVRRLGSEHTRHVACWKS